MNLGTPLDFRNFPRQKASAGGLAERLRSGLQIGPDFPLNQRTSILSSGGQSGNALATLELAILALLLSACAPPPGDCLLVDHVVYSCEELRWTSH